MHFLYTLKYYNKYYKEKMTVEFSAANENEAIIIAVDRLNEVDFNHIKEPYTFEDFSLESIDDTIINNTSVYTTRSGLKVINIVVNLNSTTAHNKVSGYIYFKNKKGEEKRKPEFTMWSLNGRHKAVLTSDLDLIKIIS